MPLVRETLEHHCPICPQYMLQSGYIKSHTRAKHPNLSTLLTKCEAPVKNLSTPKPCVWCGKQYSRRDTHLRHCLTPCVCMLLEGILFPDRPSAGEPSIHDVRSAAFSVPVGGSLIRGTADESTGRDENVLRPSSDGGNGRHGIGASTEQWQTTEAGEERRAVRESPEEPEWPGKGEGQSKGKISSWFRRPVRSDAIAKVGASTPAADGGQFVQADSSTRGRSGSTGPGHSIRDLLLQSRARTAGETLEGRRDLERHQGEAAGEHVVASHHGHVHRGGGDQKSGGMLGQFQRGDDSESLADEAGKLELSTLGFRRQDAQDRCQQGSAPSSSGPPGSPSPGGTSSSAECRAPPALASSLDGDLGGLSDCLRHGLRAEAAQEDTLMRTLSQCAITPAGLIQRSSGQAAAIRSGESHSATDREALLALRLHNPSNMCYAHSFLCAWLWSCWPLSHPDRQVSPQARSFIQLLLQARTPVCLPNLWGWSHLTRAWQEPHRQHDVAEFAQFLVGALDITHVEVHWQARLQTFAGIDIAASESTSVLRLPVIPSARDIQGLTNGRSNQGSVHALNEPLPRLAVVQIARFDGASKDCTSIECQRVINFPVFTGSMLETRAVAYTLEAVCLHRGAQAIQGHYRALLFPQNTSASSEDVPMPDSVSSSVNCSTAYLTDDDQCATPLAPSAYIPLLSREGYVCIYRWLSSDGSVISISPSL